MALLKVFYNVENTLKIHYVIYDINSSIDYINENITYGVEDV